PTRGTVRSDDANALPNCKTTILRATSPRLHAVCALVLAFALFTPGESQAAWVFGNGNSYTNRFSMSAGGRYVAFASDASNLVPGDTNNNKRQIFRVDTQTGTVVIVSVNP